MEFFIVVPERTRRPSHLQCDNAAIFHSPPSFTNTWPGMNFRSLFPPLKIRH